MNLHAATRIGILEVRPPEIFYYLITDGAVLLSTSCSFPSFLLQWQVTAAVSGSYHPSSVRRLLGAADTAVDILHPLQHRH